MSSSPLPQHAQKSQGANLIAGFRYAFHGLWYALCTQRHARIHIFIAILAIITRYYPAHLNGRVCYHFCSYYRGVYYRDAQYRCRVVRRSCLTSVSSPGKNREGCCCWCSINKCYFIHHYWTVYFPSPSSKSFLRCINRE